MKTQVFEKAKSKAQQAFMGMVYAHKKGELEDAPESVKKAAKSMTKKQARDFAKTKTKGLPEKVVKEETMTFKEFLMLGEKWEKEVKVPEKEKGKYKDWTLAELRSELADLKKSGPHEKGSKQYGKMKELQFAIRAKTGWGKV